ncbi:TPA: hypothetical protein GRR81_02915 [Vibrio parahaemolyticus]|nr:hypothetical protein [Vibrio parahaemolyticus]EGQ9497852.1 hypothetical protein [Vibrio parahaemolyticus]EGQ9503458.1 hypothetical protein [Vibrio parahaemolyticus]EGQ9813725.1 hypothetical protein [Vibrio parahaemolyticus]EGR0044498.1 hypothetical protein [Vibrio parahaemolyticus]
MLFSVWIYDAQLLVVFWRSVHSEQISFKSVVSIQDVKLVNI